MTIGFFIPSAVFFQISWGATADANFKWQGFPNLFKTLCVGQVALYFQTEMALCPFRRAGGKEAPLSWQAWCLWCSVWPNTCETWAEQPPFPCPWSEAWDVRQWLCLGDHGQVLPEGLRVHLIISTKAYWSARLARGQLRPTSHFQPWGWPVPQSSSPYTHVTERWRKRTPYQ